MKRQNQKIYAKINAKMMEKQKHQNDQKRLKKQKSRITQYSDQIYDRDGVPVVTPISLRKPKALQPPGSSGVKK